MGRPAHEPTPTSRRNVEALAGYGVPEAEIAGVVAVDPKTLRKHYRDELDTGSIKANSRIAESLYKKAMGDGPQSVTAAIFWLKTRAKWKETPIEEQNISDNLPKVIFRTIVESPPRDAMGHPIGQPVVKGPPIIEHIRDR